MRVSVGQTWGAEQRCRILDSAREFPIRDAHGVHGSSPLQVSADTRGGDTFVVVSFDKLNGAHPPPTAAQPFELVTSFK